MKGQGASGGSTAASSAGPKRRFCNPRGDPRGDIFSDAAAAGAARRVPVGSWNRGAPGGAASAASEAASPTSEAASVSRPASSSSSRVLLREIPASRSAADDRPVRGCDLAGEPSDDAAAASETGSRGDKVKFAGGCSLHLTSQTKSAAFLFCAKLYFAQSKSTNELYCRVAATVSRQLFTLIILVPYLGVEYFFHSQYKPYQDFTRYTYFGKLFADYGGATVSYME